MDNFSAKLQNKNGTSNKDSFAKRSLNKGLEQMSRVLLPFSTTRDMVENGNAMLGPKPKRAVLALMASEVAKVLVEEGMYVGWLCVKDTGKPTDILERLNEMAGFAPDEEIKLF
ncbi:hypothetical protein Tco_0421488 [Tanacetum coccineum]